MDEARESRLREIMERIQNPTAPQFHHVVRPTPAGGTFLLEISATRPAGRRFDFGKEFSTEKDAEAAWIIFLAAVRVLFGDEMKADFDYVMETRTEFAELIKEATNGR